MNTPENTIIPPLISDCTLRDGSHACNHQITEATYAAYLRVADAAKVDYLEIGHGNGLGASSLQLGESLIGEEKMIGLARSIVRNAAISTHVMPGFATMKRNIRQAVDLGVDLFRVAAHCTEADITRRHIEYVRGRDRQCWGVLMMSHMADNQTLLGEVEKMLSYGAQAVVLMDSAGTLLPKDVFTKMKMLTGQFDSRFGFHAHNNLGLSVANSIAAMEGGASIIDATILGLGAGAGNCPLEMLVAVLFHMGLQDQMKIQLKSILEVASTGRELFANDLPVNTPETIVSSLAGVFSGFAKPVVRIARALGVSPIDIFFQLGKRKIIGGQEDIILEIANDLKNHPIP